MINDFSVKFDAEGCLSAWLVSALALAPFAKQNDLFMVIYAFNTLINLLLYIFDTKEKKNFHPFYISWIDRL